MKAGTITLLQFIKQQGSIGAAAAEIGVDYGTVFRWKSHQQRPTGLAARRLKQLGIVLGPAPASARYGCRRPLRGCPRRSSTR